MDIENLERQIQEAFDKERAEQERLIIKELLERRKNV